MQLCEDGICDSKGIPADIISKRERSKGMSEQRNLIVGLDLCNDYTQMSCYNSRTFEPESVSMSPDRAKYLIPTVLGVKNDSKEWIFGEDAVSLHDKQAGVLVDNLIMKLEKELETEIFGVTFQPAALLEKYLRKCLQLLKVYHPTNSIQKIVITLKNNSEKVTDSMYAALLSLGIDRDRAHVQSHMQSYQYYALSQPKELWMNDIGLFEFDESGLIYHQITVNRKTHPHIVGMIDKDFSGTLSFDMLEELKGSENLEYIFENIANSILFKQVVSTVYVTGIGFEGDWADNVLKELCAGRRVFKGQNLYTKGACYAAKEMTGEHKLEDYLFLSNEMIMSTFLIEGYYDAKQTEIVLAKAGTPWYDVDERLDLILDNEEAVTITIHDVMKRESVTHTLKLTGLPKRPNRVTRLELRLKFLSRNSAAISVKDKGFGEFYPSTNRIWEKEIKL